VSIGSTASDARNLSVKNTVRNVTRGETTGRSATTANPGDRIHIDIEVEALGNASQTEVEARYTLPSRLALASGDPNLLVNSISLGNMSPGAKKTLSFEATALSGDAVTVLPEARVKSSEVPEKKSQATIFIRGGDVASNRPSTTFDSSNTFPGPSPAPTPASAVAGAATGQRVSVINKTLNADAAAVGARPGEVLLVSLTSVNSTASAAEQAVQADVRDLMMLSQITNTGSPAGVVDNGIIKFPSATLTPGSTVTRTFEATILPAGQILTAADRTIVLAYGNTVSVNVDPNSRSSSVAGAATGPIVPPRTGASENTAILLSFLTTAGYWLIRNSKFQITNPK
jgi:hypothetical protein